jgi:PAS domain S-box-containing protein
MSMRLAWSGRGVARAFGTALFLAAVLFGSAALYFVLVYVPRERARTIERWSHELELRAEVRTTAIDGWVAAGLSDAALVASYPAVQQVVLDLDRGARAREREQAAAHLENVLRSFARLKGYLRLFVFDRTARVVATTTGGTAIEPACLAALGAPLRHGVRTADFHLHADGSPVVAFLAAVGEPGSGDAHEGGVLLEATPTAWLYPYLTSRSSVNRTSEALLVRREESSVVFLTPLRYSPAPPLTLRLPLGTPDLVAAAAFQGDRAAPGIDYRGAPVLAASHRIQGAPWAVVLKVDQADVLSAFRSQVRSTAAAGGATIGALAVLLLALWWAQRSYHQLDLIRSRARFGLLLDQANDGVLFLARDGRILEANRKAEEMYGRSREELLGMTALDLRPEGASAQVHSDLETIARQGKHVFESTNCRRDGSTFPVEVSSRLIDLDGKPAFLSVLRDISERRQNEEEQARFVRRSNRPRNPS